MAVNQVPTLSSPKSDPLRNFVWQVTIRPHVGGAVVAGFMTVAGLGMTVDVIPYREGHMNTTSQKLPGQTDFQPITMTEGVIVGPQPRLDWIKKLFLVNQGSGKGTYAQSPGSDFRASLDIEVLDHPVNTATRPVKAQFVVYNAWPTSIAFSDLDAGANQLLVEQISFAHEGIDPQVAAAVGASEAAPPNFLQGKH